MANPDEDPVAAALGKMFEHSRSPAKAALYFREAIQLAARPLTPRQDAELRSVRRNLALEDIACARIVALCDEAKGKAANEAPKEDPDQ